MSGGPSDRAVVWATVVAGFLGSGKTTLVRRLLTRLDRADVAVLVNDFGEVGLDGALIGADGADVVELAGGCVCCAMHGDLVRALDEAVAARPALRTVIIEASGIADPAPIVAQLLRTRLRRPVALDALVTVVDCANFDRNLEKAEVAYSQLVYADVLVLNKTDLVDVADADAIEVNLRKLNSSAAMVRAVEADVPVEVIVGGARGGEGVRNRLPMEVTPGHRHDGFETATLMVRGPVDLDRLGDWVARDLAGVDRAKGVVRLDGASAPSVLHYVGGRWSMVQEPGIAAGDQTVVTVIGRGLDRERLRRGLQAATIGAGAATTR